MPHASTQAPAIQAPAIQEPASEGELAALIKGSQHPRIRIVGGGTRAGLQMASTGDLTLTTRKLTGITLYEPAEMVIAARAGTPVADVEAALAERGQYLPFEPMDHRALLQSQGEPTIGAVAAMNISGPRRIAVGAARDAMIGLRFINGQGEVIRAGGRVMKNVTGLDMVKLQAGAFGQLGAISEVTFKVLPRQAESSTLVLHGLSDDKGIEVLGRALGSPFDVTGAAHLPGEGTQAARTLIRIENVADSVVYRAQKLVEHLKGYGTISQLHGTDSEAIWRIIRDVDALEAMPDAVIWRLSLKPGDAPKVVAAFQAQRSAQCLYDWGGGLVWLATSPEGDGGLAQLRQSLAGVSGHARLERGSDALKASVSAIPSADPATLKLEAGIRHAVDPKALFAANRPLSFAFPFASPLFVTPVR
jgi:glycolate oxidase FAD binding subunit